MFHARLRPVVALALSACTTSSPLSQLDVHCVEWHQVPIVINGETHLARGACKAWVFGPTRQQQENFDKQHQGGAR